jgi:HAD superfamily hydrolase (TIGR01509 family)
VLSATLFDFNGVLVDDEDVHLAAFSDVLSSLGVTLSNEVYAERYLGYDDAGAFRAILSDHGIEANEQKVKALVEAKRPRYRTRAEASLVVFDGAERLVRACAAAGPVGIVSGALRDEIVFALGRMGVAEAVTFIVSAEDAPRCKPDPEGYLMARALLGPERAQFAVAIEDSFAGIEAARKAGLSCVAVAHSYSETDLYARGAQLVLPHIRDLTTDMLANVKVS